jgi:hypothetical protein
LGNEQYGAGALVWPRRPPFSWREERVYLILAAATLPPFLPVGYTVLGAVSGRYMLPFSAARYGSPWGSTACGRRAVVAARRRLASLAWFSWFSLRKTPVLSTPSNMRAFKARACATQYLAPDAERVSRSLARMGFRPVLLLYNAPLTETVQPFAGNEIRRPRCSI